MSRFTEDEKDFIRANPQMTSYAIAKVLGRTKQGVSHARKRLGPARIERWHGGVRVLWTPEELARLDEVMEARVRGLSEDGAFGAKPY